MTYFAKPNFIVNDEWFDNDLKKTKLDFKNKKITNSSKIHEFFYEKSNYKIGASENNLQLDIKVNKQELRTNHYFNNISESYSSESNKKLKLFRKSNKRKINFNIKRKLIYSLSLLVFVFIFGFSLLFFSQSRKNESKITNKSFILEKNFQFAKRTR